MDPLVSKMLFLHVPSRYPQVHPKPPTCILLYPPASLHFPIPRHSRALASSLHSCPPFSPPRLGPHHDRALTTQELPDIEVPPLVQSCALVGVGLLYQGTSHRLVVETMLEALVPPPWEPTGMGASAGAAPEGREGYSLCAGFALGLVMLGQGRGAPGLGDLRIEDRLSSLLAGGSLSAAVGRGDRCDSPLRSNATRGAQGQAMMYFGSRSVLVSPACPGDKLSLLARTPGQDAPHLRANRLSQADLILHDAHRRSPGRGCRRAFRCCCPGSRLPPHQ